MPADLEQLLLDCQKSPDRRLHGAAALQARLRACDDAPRCNEEESRAWFATHGPTLRGNKERSTVSGAATIAVDLERRRVPPPRSHRAGSRDRRGAG